jgi:hypothetical protein
MPSELAEQRVTAIRDLDDLPADPLLEPMSEPTYDEIAVEAYGRWVARGGGDGSDVADWLEAEEALRTQRQLVPVP